MPNCWPSPARSGPPPPSRCNSPPRGRSQSRPRGASESPPAASHAAIARATSVVLSSLGIEHPRRHGGFYLYSNFDSHRAHLADARSIHTGTDLATTLLEQYGIATLPASAFGESDETLALRLATSQLYGDSDHKTETALSHPHPATLPWIKDHLQNPGQLPHHAHHDSPDQLD